MNFDPDVQNMVPIPTPEPPLGPTNTVSFRNTRRRKRLTAAALIVGSGAAAVTLTYDLIPAATPLAGSVASSSGVGTSAVTSAHGGPQVTHTVATTSASGVTTTTTTRVVSGKTVVTKSTSAAAYHDR